MKKVLLLISLIMLFPVSAYAYSCDYNEQARLRRIASNVMTSYEYVENNDNVTFNVTLTNITNEIYILDTTTNKKYYYNGSNEITINGYGPNTNIRYLIYPTKNDCMASFLTTKYVNTPYYNKFYKDELCKGKTYSICNKWVKVSLTYDEFVKTINELDNKKNEEVDVIDQENEKDTIFDIITSFIFKNYLYIIAIGGTTIIIVEFIKSRKKNKIDL